MRALLILLVALAAPAWSEPQAVTLGARQYLIDRPDQSSGAMILVLHGGGGNPAQFAQMTGFSAPALSEGYTVIYPAASQPKNITMWTTGKPSKGRADDIAFLDQVVVDASTRFGLDASRVYLAGMSNGAAMAEAYAMARAGRIKAVAAVSGTLDLSQPVAAVPMLIIHGSADARVPFEGGKGTKTKIKTANFPPIPDQVAALVAAFGDLVPQVSLIDPVDDGMQVRQTDYSNAGVVQVRLMKIEGGGHIWPGRPRKGSAQDISANTEALRFFAEHP